MHRAEATPASQPAGPPAPRSRPPPTQLGQRVGVREATCERRRAAVSQRPERGQPGSPLGNSPPGSCRSGAQSRPRARPPPSRTWQQVGEAPHGALQLGRGGRVSPHVLLVALAQQAQPRRQAATGRSRSRRCRCRRHGSHGPALPGPPPRLRAPPSPAEARGAGQARRPSAERLMGGGAGG